VYLIPLKSTEPSFTFSITAASAISVLALLDLSCKYSQITSTIEDKIYEKNHTLLGRTFSSLSVLSLFFWAFSFY
jgi:hypothetical protein